MLVSLNLDLHDLSEADAATPQTSSTELTEKTPSVQLDMVLDVITLALPSCPVLEISQ